MDWLMVELAVTFPRMFAGVLMTGLAFDRLVGFYGSTAWGSVTLPHVTAIELAGWIRTRRAGLQIVDVTGAAASVPLLIPGAVPVEMGDLVRAAARLRPTGDAPVSSQQRVEILRRRGC